ncbi:transposase [Scytonema sp. PCC 10023]|uniref:transposase n=1 Tax=Scytonema sp. PCC 10023 TaxID=1680591 RepID=UPI0039C74429
MVYDQKAISVYFDFLPKLGSSNFDEQTKIISHILPLFKEYKVIVLGDREFCSVKLANWLREQRLLFCLRLKKTEFLEKEDGVWSELNNLGLKPRVSLFIEGVKVTKRQRIDGFNIAAKWKRNAQRNCPKRRMVYSHKLGEFRVSVSEAPPKETRQLQKKIWY